MANGIIRFDEGWRLDEGHHFDQPPNFLPPVLPPVLPAIKKGKSMDFFPSKRAVQYQWLQNLSTNVVTEAAKFGGVAGDATAMKAQADAILAKMDITDSAAAALDGARNIEGSTLAANLASIRAKVKNWKTLAGYPASGSEAVLKLKGSGPAFDPTNYKPVITVSLVAGKPQIDFTKLGVDGVAIYCRLAGTGTWRKLAVDTESPYVDTAPLAQAGVPELREYKARGVVNDVEIGQDSDVVSIAFAG